MKNYLLVKYRFNEVMELLLSHYSLGMLILKDV